MEEEGERIMAVKQTSLFRRRLLLSTPGKGDLKAHLPSSSSRVNRRWSLCVYVQQREEMVKEEL